MEVLVVRLRCLFIMNLTGDYNRQLPYINPYLSSDFHTLRPRTDVDYQIQSEAPKRQIIINEPPQSSRNLNTQKTKIVFQGFAFELQLFLREQKREELLSVTEAEVYLMGMKVKDVNNCIPFCCGFLGAYLYCVCNFLFCCSCRQKVVYSVYEVNIIGYENIVRLIQACPNLIVLKLKVKDNCLNQPKAIVLEQALRIGSVKRFQLSNQALGVSIQPDKSYEDFIFNFKRLKKLRIETTIKWEDTVVL